MAVALVAVALLTLGVLAPAAFGVVDRGTRRLGAMVGDVASRTIAIAMWAIVLLPIWALSRLTRFMPLDLGWVDARSAFLETSTRREPASRLSDPFRAGLREPRAARSIRRRGHLRLVVPLLLAACVLAAAMLKAAPTTRASGLPGEFDMRRTPTTNDPSAATGPVEWAGLPVDDFAHDGEPWAQDLFRELLDARPSPDLILGQRLVDRHGEHLNIEQGRRVSYTPADADLAVWFFGGSTMFGLGQRDDHTIPSLIARAAEADGIMLRPLNFGVSSDVNWVSTIRFAEAINTLPEPDLVVFYDGVNDFGLASERVAAGVGDPSRMDRLSVSDSERAAQSGSTDGASDTGVSSIVDLAATQYRRSTAVARDLAGAHDVPVVFVWQPSPFARPGQPGDEELFRRIGFDPSLLPVTTSLYEEILETSGVDAIDVSDALDDTARPVYFDGAHTNELGARLVARALYDELRSSLDDLD